jgi:hypothetical protein
VTPLQAAAALVSLAEEGCALAAAGRLEDLDGLQPRWDAAVAAMGPRREHAPDVIALLDRAMALQGEQTAILAAAQAEIAEELGRLRRTRQGARGYAGSTGLAGTPRRLDASA